MKTKNSLRTFLFLASSTLLAAFTAHATSTTWNVNVDGSWATDANWLSGSAPGATSGTTSPDLATFGNVIGAARAITVDANRNIFGIDFAANSFAYNLSGGNLLLTNGGFIQTSGAGSAHTDTISSAIQLLGDGGTPFFTAGSSTNTRLLVISGGVTGVSTGSNVTTLTLNGGNTGGNTVSGIIANGTGGGKLALVKSGAGTWNITNIATSFTGGLTISGGTLSFGDSRALNNNKMTVTGSSTLTAFTNSTGNTSTSGGLNVSAGTTLSIGIGSTAFSYTQTGVLEGLGTVRGVGASATGIITNFLNTANTFTGTLNTNAGTTAIGGFNVASLGDGGQIVLGSSGTSPSTFSLAGNAVATTFNTRQFVLSTNGTHTANINNNATIPSSILTIGTALSVTSTGTKTLSLGGTNTGLNVFKGDITNGSGTVAVTKAGSGTWALGGTNTYSGVTINGFNNPPGTFIFQGLQSLSNNTDLQQTHLGGVGSFGTIKLLDDSASPASRSGVDLLMIASNGSHQMNLFVGNNNVANGGTSASTQNGSTITLGNLTMTQTVIGNTSQELLVSGANGYGLSIGSVSIATAAAYTGIYTAKFTPSTAPLTITGTVRQTTASGAGSSVTLNLDGTASGHLISGNILNSAVDATKLLTVTKNNSSTWTLSGTNSYTGGTNVTGGRLNITGNSSGATGAVAVSAGTLGGNGSLGGAVTVSATGGIDLRDGAVGNLTLGSTLNITGALGTNNLRFDLGNTTGTSDLLSVGDTTSVTTTGAAVINLNQFGGVAGRTATTYTLIGGAGTLDATNFANFSLATTKAFGQTYALVHDSATENGNLQVSATNVTSVTPAAFWKGGDINWSSSSNWNTDTASNVGTGAAPDYQTNVTFSATGAMNTTTNVLDIDFDINSLAFNAAAGGVIIGGIKMLTIEATDANLNTAGNGITSANTSGTNTVSSKVGLAASQTWTVGTGGTLAVSGAISDLGGGFGITKAGLGDLNLSGTNTFTGATTISEGVLRLDSSTALSGTSGVSITSGASLFIRASSPTFGIGQTLTLNGTGATGTGALVTSTSGTTTWNGPVTLGSDSLVLAGGGTVLNIGGTINLSNFTLTANSGAGANVINATFSNGISGTGGLTKIGNGTLSLSRPFTYIGVTTINAGALQLAGGSQSGGDIVINNGGSLVIAATGGQTAGTTISNNIVLGGTTASKTLHVYQTNNRANFTGGISVTPGLSTTLNVTAGNIPGGSTLGDRVDLLISGPITDLSGSSNGTLGLNVTMTTQSAAFTFVNLSGLNTFQGALTANTSTASSTGYLTIGGESNNTTGANVRNVVTMGSGYLGGGNYTGAITLNASGAGATTILDYLSSANQILAGQISGVGQLLKEGTGTLTLSGANSYTGVTTVSAGTLLINGNQTTATGSVAVNGISTLGGNGTIGGAVTVAGAANLAPGNSVGTLNMTSTLDIAALAAGAGKLNYELGTIAVSDKIAVTGTLTIGTDVLDFSNFNFTALGGLQNGTYKLITSGAPISGTLDLITPGVLTGPVGTGTGTLQVTGNDVELLVSGIGGGPGPLDHFAISAISSPQTVGTPITGITLTAQDASNATVSSFSGTVNFGGTGGFTGTSATFSSGMLSGVSVTPTNAGSGLTFTVTEIGSGKTGSTTITTIQTQYEAWSGGAGFNLDANGDGVKNGLAWLLGATNKDVSALTLLPVVTQSGGDLVLTFTCLKVAGRVGAVLNVEHSSDLGISDAWAAAAVPDTATTVSGVDFIVPSVNGDPNLVNLQATIPASNAVSGKLFGRLKAVKAP